MEAPSPYVLAAANAAGAAVGKHAGAPGQLELMGVKGAGGAGSSVTAASVLAAARDARAARRKELLLDDEVRGRMQTISMVNLVDACVLWTLGMAYTRDVPPLLTKLSMLRVVKSSGGGGRPLRLALEFHFAQALYYIFHGAMPRSLTGVYHRPFHVWLSRRWYQHVRPLRMRGLVS